MTKDREKELSAEARKILNDYVRNWRKKNPERVRDINIRYWNKKAKEVLQEIKNNSKDERK
jgi:hypothetical protein